MLIAISLLLFIGSILAMYFLEIYKQNWLRKNGVEILKNHFTNGAKIPDSPLYYSILSNIIVWISTIGIVGFIVGVCLFLFSYL